MEMKKALRNIFLCMLVCTSIILLQACSSYRNNLPSVDELLEKADKAFISEQYLDALKIYLDESLNQEPVALNNLGYMLITGTGAAKDIPKGLAYYKQAADLGNLTAMDNYILTMLQYPTTYDEVMNALIEGHKKGSSIAETFIENISMHPSIVEIYGNLSPDDIWSFSYDDWRISLEKITVEDGIILKDELLRREKGDFIGDLCYRNIQVLIGYRTEYISENMSVKKPVYGTTRELAYRTYRLDYVENPSVKQTFIFLDNE